mgnify:CR=1 FL=1
MNLKQIIFLILSVGLAGGLPVFAFPEAREAILFSYGLTTLIVLAVIGATELYVWLGEH